jgi:hypothetical protein
MLGIVVSSVEIGWHEDHSIARCFTLKLLELYVDIDNLRLDGPLGKSGGLLVGKGRECDVKSQHL